MKREQLVSNHELYIMGNSRGNWSRRHITGLLLVISHLMNMNEASLKSLHGKRRPIVVGDRVIKADRNTRLGDGHLTCNHTLLFSNRALMFNNFPA